MDKNKPKKFVVEFTTQTCPNVVEQDFVQIKKFIQNFVGNLTEEVTLKVGSQITNKENSFLINWLEEDLELTDKGDCSARYLRNKLKSIITKLKKV
tara:strand:- start:21 stop:308 length:288 start_codon:yes stop_codon:yes gene_type:complete